MVKDVKLNREDILQQLESVQAGLSARELVEQSSCFVFKDGLVMTYNDEIACRHKCDLPITGAVQAEPLLNILRKLQEEELEFSQKEGELRIYGKRRQAGIRMEQELLLPIDNVEEPQKWKSLPPDFAEAIYIVQQCAGKDESKFFTTCVHIHSQWLEAFDGAQCSRFPLETKVKEPILVRRDSIKHVVDMDPRKFSETPTWIHFKNKTGLIMSMRRHVEEYPDLSPIFEMNGSRTVLPKGLGEACEKAEIFSQENTEDNHVFVELQPGKLRIKGSGVSGWYKESKKIQYDGEPISFYIPPKLMAELSKRHNECEITADRLKVDGGKFVYVSSLGNPNETSELPTPDEE